MLAAMPVNQTGAIQGWHTCVHAPGMFRRQRYHSFIHTGLGSAFGALTSALLHWFRLALNLAGTLSVIFLTNINLI